MQYTKEELNKFLESHLHWIKEDCDGWEGMRANLSRANLSGANLSRADLFGANLSEANLSRADLSGANLSEADLSGANLSRADLSRADLSGVDLSRADLSGAKNIPLIPYTCPDFGTFIGWKKAGDKIICLEIPEDAKRLSATGRKCRCDKAKVLNITELDGSPCELTEIPSNRDKDFIYKVGEVVSVPDFDENRWNECSTGIHFFINRQEAVEYDFW